MLSLAFGSFSEEVLLSPMASSDSQGESYCPRCMNSCADSVRCGHSSCQVCKLDEEEMISGQLDWSVVIDDKTPHKGAQEETGIFCSYCIHSSVPAVKSCLHCQASLCDDHMKVHHKSAEHVLTSPTTSMEDRKCPIHRKILEYYCHNDNVCICVYCLAEEHRFHQLETMDKASVDKRKKLKDLLVTLTLESDDTEKLLQRVIRNMMEIPKNISDMKEKVSNLFQDIRRQLEDLEKNVLHEICRQESEIIEAGNVQMQQLQIKKTQLARKMIHLEELCNESDPLALLQCGDLYGESEDHKKDGLKEADKTIDQKEELNEFLIALTLHNGLNNIVTEIRKEFYIPEAKGLLLDLNTAANNVLVSSDLKLASWSVLGQRRKETAKRFQQYQVLSTQRFSAGRHYWEVETSQSEYWMMGVTYPSTDPKSSESWVGNNSKSWSFCRWFNEYSIRHDNKDISTLPDLSCNRLGVYLDYEAGQVSFYELGDPIRHIYTFTATFTEPLYAAFYVEDNGWLRIRS